MYIKCHIIGTLSSKPALIFLFVENIIKLVSKSRQPIGNLGEISVSVGGKNNSWHLNE